MQSRKELTGRVQPREVVVADVEKVRQKFKLLQFDATRKGGQRKVPQANGLLERTKLLIEAPATSTRTVKARIGSSPSFSFAFKSLKYLLATSKLHLPPNKREKKISTDFSRKERKINFKDSQHVLLQPNQTSFLRSPHLPHVQHSYGSSQPILDSLLERKEVEQSCFWVLS